MAVALIDRGSLLAQARLEEEAWRGRVEGMVVGTIVGALGGGSAVALPSADDARVRSAADVRRLAHLCDCSGGRAEQSAKSCLAAVPSSWRCGRMARVALLAAAHVATHGSRERKG